jgi:O-antigen/teichoic acid export membrane protein
MVVSQALTWLMYHVALRAEARRAGVPIRFQGCFRESRILFSFAVPAVAGGLLTGPANWTCTALLVNRPNGYAEMGVYNAATQWFTALMFLPNILAQVILPMLSERLGQDDHRRSAKILNLSIRLNAIIVAPVVLVGCLVSPWIMGLYGVDFTSGSSTLIAVLITAGLCAIQDPVGQIIPASGRMWLGFVMNAGWAIVFLGATAILVSRGAFGLAGARLLAYAVHSFWIFGFAYLLVRAPRSSPEGMNRVLRP